MGFEEVLPDAQKARKLPVVLSPEEVASLSGLRQPHNPRVILTTCYAAGLRISEAVHLKPTAIDSKRMVIRVEQGKNQKDRYVMLSPKLLDILRSYWCVGRPRFWLFPGDQPEQPITAGAIESACQKARHLARLSKPVTPHSLRHAFAVHLLESGADLRTIQLLMGHRSLATTAQYLRIATNKVCATTSPLDLLPRPVPAEPTTSIRTILTSRPMGRCALELADVFRRYGEAYREQHGASLAQSRVMTAIELCRTASLGGHVEKCDNCGHQRICYNSCLMGKFRNGELASPLSG